MVLTIEQIIDESALSSMLQRKFCEVGFAYNKRLALFNEKKSLIAPKVVAGFGGALGLAFGWHPAVCATVLALTAVKTGLDWYYTSAYEKQLDEEYGNGKKEEERGA